MTTIQFRPTLAFSAARLASLSTPITKGERSFVVGDQKVIVDGPKAKKLAELLQLKKLANNGHGHYNPESRRSEDNGELRQRVERELSTLEQELFDEAQSS